MRCITFTNPGGPQVLTLAECPTPVPKPDEVLVQVAAAGVNRPDIFQRQGQYPPPPGASPILGLEVAGTVVAVGSKVQQWQPGNTVCALTNGGGYADYAAIPASQCLPVPAGLSLLQAASLPETFFTVWANVFDRCRLQAGETLLVHGGSSGIGVAAIQIATALGATVIVTAGSETKCRACINLGAAYAINYREQNFVEAVTAATDGNGADVILDMVGGDTIQQNIQAAASDGRITWINFQNGAKATVNFLPVMTKRLTLTGSTLRPQPASYKARLAQALQQQVWPHIESGQIKAVIQQVFPLANAAAAHKLLEQGGHIGKIMLAVQTD